MSMLAERKRKQKWSLNPRGKIWSDDANKFGQRMLEKMGWQHGKGLGANQNGITEHIKISVKNDSKGMGYKESNDQWTEHESNFSALLESLGGGNKVTEQITINSLEEKSQTSRVRVHYHKFTRGKDLSRYSEKDLANIFGKRDIKEISKSDQEKNEQNKELDEHKTDTNGTNLLFSGGSMKDYFQKKLPNFGKTNGYVIGNNGVLKKDSESESEAEPSFGFGFKSEMKSDSETKKEKCSFISYIKDDINKRKAEDYEHNIFSPRKKIKKEKLKSHDTSGISNPAFNPLATPVKVDKHTLHTIEESSFEELYENKNTNEVEISCSSSIENCESVHDEHGKKKKKKIKRIIDDIEMEYVNPNDTLDSNIEIEQNIEITDSFQTRKEFNVRKKGKKRESNSMSKENNFSSINKLSESSLEHEENNENSISTNNNIYEVKIKKQKKNKSKDIGNLAISNPMFVNEQCNDQATAIQENPFEVRRKDKKKKNKTSEVDVGLNNPVFNDNMENSTLENESHGECLNPYELKPKKKKKKKIDQEKLGVFNPNFKDVGKDYDENIVSSVEENGKIRFKKTNKEVIGEKNDISIERENCIAIKNSAIELNPYEVKRKNKKDKTKKPKSDTAMSLETVCANMDPSNVQYDSINLDNCDLMLNVVCEPIPPKPKSSKIENVGIIEKARNVKRRKSVRFSDVTQEVIIPNNEELKRFEDEYESGIDNVNFDSVKTQVDENLDTISKTLDMYEAEIENDMNEQKQTVLDDIMIGDIGNLQGENEKLSDGTKLKFKYADFDTRTPMYQLNKIGAKKSYKHLIKGDIFVKFNNTNLHEIKGYAAVKWKNKN